MSQVNVKRTMGEIRLDKLGLTTQSRYGRNTLYRKLQTLGYHWDKKYSIWVKAG